MITHFLFLYAPLEEYWGKKPHPKKGNWLLRLGLAEGVGMVTVTITFSQNKFVEFTVSLFVTKAALQ